MGALWVFAALVLVLAAWAVFQWFVFSRNVHVGSADLDVRGPNIPKLLVEPFQDVTGTTEGATIAKGLTEEVVGKLTSFKDLVVVVFDPRRPDSAATEANSAIRYTLAASVRIEGDAIRLSARLIDRANGSVLWANNYDGSRGVRRLLDMEADVAVDVATALGQPYGIIFRADVARASNGPPDEWDAYACTLAYYSYRMVLDQQAHASVKQCLERAVQRFPGYATAWALLSLIYLDEVRFGYRINTTAQASLDLAIDAARQAVALDPTNARAMQAQMLGLFFKNEVDEALKVGERAVAINPNDTELVGAYGMRLALSGEWPRGCALVSQALERNPAPLGFYDVALALCSYMQRDYQKAEFWIRKADIEEQSTLSFRCRGNLWTAPRCDRRRTRTAMDPRQCTKTSSRHST